MRILLRLLFGKHNRTRKPKKRKKKLIPVLLDKLLGIPVSTLERKLNDDMWKPDF